MKKIVMCSSCILGICCENIYTIKNTLYDFEDKYTLIFLLLAVTYFPLICARIGTDRTL